MKKLFLVSVFGVLFFNVATFTVTVETCCLDGLPVIKFVDKKNEQYNICSAEGEASCHARNQYKYDTELINEVDKICKIDSQLFNEAYDSYRQTDAHTNDKKDPPSSPAISYVIWKYENLLSEAKKGEQVC